MTQFHLIGHACVLISSDGFNLLTDPWFGSDFHFQTFFSFPPWQQPAAEILRRIDAIHISHIHQDHFCGRSLSLLPKSSSVLIARHVNQIFKDRVQSFGFDQLIEISPFGEPARIGPFTIHVFTPKHFDGSFDSSALISDGRNSFYFMNDCRLSENQYHEIKARHPSITACFLNYNSVNPYPTCYEFQIPERPLVSLSSELERMNSFGLKHFENAIRILDPSWVAPYAANIRFLKKKIFHHNRIFAGLPEKARALLGVRRFIEWLPGDEINERGELAGEPKAATAEPGPNDVVGDSDFHVESKVLHFSQASYRDLFTMVWQKNKKQWSFPLKLTIKVQCPDQPMLFHFSPESEGPVPEVQDPHMTVEYEAGDLAKILNGEMTFSNLHYAYLFKATIHSVIPGSCLIHQWR